MGEDEVVLVLVRNSGVTAEADGLFGQNCGLYAEVSLPQPGVEAEVYNTILIIISLHFFYCKLKNRVVVAI